MGLLVRGFVHWAWSGPTQVPMAQNVIQTQGHNPTYVGECISTTASTTQRNAKLKHMYETNSFQIYKLILKSKIVVNYFGVSLYHFGLFGWGY